MTAFAPTLRLHGTLKPPFRLADGMIEQLLLRNMMHFAGQHQPVRLPRLEVVRLGKPLCPCAALRTLRGYSVICRGRGGAASMPFERH